MTAAAAAGVAATGVRGPFGEAVENLAAATEHQPRARAVLASALAHPSHAYLFTGPSGSGRQRAARAFAAELLADGSANPEEARRRALLVPSPHPDLEWLEPLGVRHRIEDLRERVVAKAQHRPYEGSRRIFVIAVAESMAVEGQNALLKTLEEPAEGSHLILITREPAAVLPTVRSRCQTVEFVALPPEAIGERLRGEFSDLEPDSALSLARLAGGDVERALFLADEDGRVLREAAESSARAAVSNRLGDAPWQRLLEIAAEAGELAGERLVDQAKNLNEELGETDTAAGKRRFKEAGEDGKRLARRVRTETLDLGLAIIGSWWRDLCALAEGASEFVDNVDRRVSLTEDAEGVDPIKARRAVELTLQTRSRLRVNVSEELALEAMFYRAAFLLEG